MFSLTNRTTVLLALSGIILLAFFLRLHRAGTYGIYFDEKSTLLISQGVCLEGANQRDVFSKKYFTPQEFWKPKTIADFIEANIRGDIGNSPAYYAVLWLWMEVFGLSDLSMRMPSILFSTLTVLLVYLFVRRHFRSEALALTSSAIAAIEPFFIAYSHMARNYSMSFFLTLLATHLFLLIMERVQSRPRKPATGLYVAYGLTFILSLLSHYLTITVFLCHGIYALFFLRKSSAWFSLGITALLGLGMVSLWFIFGGGKYTFQTLDYQAKLYRKVALTHPTDNQFGLVLPATFINVAKRATPVFTDLVFFTNGLGSALLGVRNSLLALLLGFLATALIYRYRSQRVPPVWVKWTLPALLLAGLPVYTAVPLRFLVLSALLPFCYLTYLYLRENLPRQNRHLVVMLLLIGFVPTLFLLAMAFRSGHTFGITQRYSGFSFPYIIILVSMMLLKLLDSPNWIRLPLAAVFLLQLAFIGQLLGLIYADSEPKYTYFGKPRMANPYWSSAQRIKELYTPGDTILYPNMKRIIYSDVDKTYTGNVSLLDAQLVNVYLPPTADYLGRVDPLENNKLVLVKGKTNEKILIFDFKGNTYRY